jgi:hypothetical protein
VLEVNTVADEEFIRERVELIKEIADQADPFIRARLLKLAEVYERGHKPSAFGTFKGLESKKPPER